MRNPLKALGQRITALGRKAYGKIIEGLGLTPFEGDKRDLHVLDEIKGEIEPVSRFAIEIGLPNIVVASEEIPSGNVLPAEEETFVSSTRLTNEERGRLLRVEEKVKDLIRRFQDYRQFQDSVKIDIKTLNNSLEHLERVLDDMKDLRDGYSSVEKNLHELSALYDLISTQYNPFVDSTPQASLFPGAMNGDVGGGETEEGASGAYVSEVCLLEWLAFLVTRIEAKQVPLLLKQYEENDVISSALRIKALKFLRSIKPSGVKPATTNDWRLSVEDQICSMEYINKIRGIQVGRWDDCGTSQPGMNRSDEPQTRRN